jgi:serine/threonine-protein kinase RsbW
MRFRKDALGSDPPVDEQPGQLMLDVTVAAVPAGPAAARAAVGRAVSGHVADAVLADAELLVSELVTNSVRHAGLGADELVRVGVHLVGATLRLEVDNPGTAGTFAAREPDLDRGGFGLRAVQELGRAWGVTRDVDTRVWVEMHRWPAAS